MKAQATQQLSIYLCYHLIAYASTDVDSKKKICMDGQLDGKKVPEYTSLELLEHDAESTLRSLISPPDICRPLLSFHIKNYRLSCHLHLLGKVYLLYLAIAFFMSSGTVFNCSMYVA